MAQDCKFHDSPCTDLENIVFGEDGIPAQGDSKANFELFSRNMSCAAEYDVENYIHAKYKSKHIVRMKTFTQLVIKAHDFQSKVPYALSRIYCTKDNRCTALAADALMCIPPAVSKLLSEENRKNEDMNYILQNTNKCFRVGGAKVLASSRNSKSVQIAKTEFTKESPYQDKTIDFGASGFGDVRATTRNRVLLDAVPPCTGVMFLPSTEEGPYNLLTRYCTRDPMGNKVVVASRAALYYDLLFEYEDACPKEGESYKIQDFARGINEGVVISHLHSIESGNIVKTVGLYCSYSNNEANVRYAIIRSIVADETTASAIDAVEEPEYITIDGIEIVVERVTHVANKSYNLTYATTYGPVNDDFEHSQAQGMPRVYMGIDASKGLCSIRNTSDTGKDNNGMRLSLIIKETALRTANRYVSPEQLQWISVTLTQIAADNAGISWSNTILTSVATVAACVAYPSNPVARRAWGIQQNGLPPSNTEARARIISVIIGTGYALFALTGTISQIVFMADKGKVSDIETEFNTVTTPAFRGYESYAAYERTYVQLIVYDNGWVYKIILIVLSGAVGLLAIFKKAARSHNKYSLHPPMHNAQPGPPQPPMHNVQLGQTTP